MHGSTGKTGIVANKPVLKRHPKPATQLKKEIKSSYDAIAKLLSITITPNPTDKTQNVYKIDPTKGLACHLKETTVMDYFIEFETEIKSKYRLSLNSKTPSKKLEETSQELRERKSQLEKMLTSLNKSSKKEENPCVIKHSF